jgi:hypothetical protein
MVDKKVHGGQEAEKENKERPRPRYSPKDMIPITYFL